MAPLRRLALHHPHRWLLLVLGAMAMRLLVPTGFMPVAHDGAVTIEICGAKGGAPLLLPAPGQPADPHSDTGHAAAFDHCPFAAAASPLLGGADPVLLAVAVRHLFVAALHGAPVALPASPAFALPPLRGPPAFR